MHCRNEPREGVTACHLGDLTSCTEQSGTTYSHSGSWTPGAPCEVRTVTSAPADDSQSTLFLQLSLLLPLPPSLSQLSPLSWLLSLPLSAFTLLSLSISLSPASLAPSHQSFTCWPHSQLFRLTHSPSEHPLYCSSLLPLPLFLFLSLLPLSLTHTYTHTYVLSSCHFLHLHPLCLLSSSRTQCATCVRKPQTQTIAPIPNYQHQPYPLYSGRPFPQSSI